MNIKSYELMYSLKGSLAGLIQLSRDTSLVSKIKLFVGLGTTVKTTHSKTALIKMLKRMDINTVIYLPPYYFEIISKLIFLQSWFTKINQE